MQGPVSRSLRTSRQLSLRGAAAMEQGRADEARTLLAKAVKACPDDPEARHHYAEALWLCGEKDQATVELATAAEALDEDPSLKIRLAEMYLETGKTDLALNRAEAAIDMNPKMPGGWAVRGEVMHSAGRFEEALADYHRALGYAPGDRKLMMQVAAIYNRTNRPAQELATLQSLADSYSPGEEPQNVLRRMGTAMVALGRYDDGIESLSTALTRGSPTPDIFYHLSQAELSAGNPDRAAMAAREALALQPNHAPSQRMLEHLEATARADGRIRR